MTKLFYNPKKTSSKIQKLLHKHNEKTNPHCKLTAEGSKYLSKLEGIANKIDWE